MKHQITFFISLILFSVYASAAQFQDSWNGSYYHHNSSPQYQWALHYLTLIDLSQFNTILDVGCGSGAVAATLAQRYPHATIVGVDSSVTMIAQAQKEYGDIKNLSFECMPAETLTFNNQFDLVISFATLHWIENKQAVFNSIAQSLKPQGKTFIVTAGKSGSSLLRMIMEVSRYDLWKSLLSSINADCYELDQIMVYTLLRNASLLPISVEEIMISRSFETLENMGLWMNGWIGGISEVAKLSSDQRAALINDVMSYYSFHNSQSEGSIINIRPNLIIQAQKQ